MKPGPATSAATIPRISGQIGDDLLRQRTRILVPAALASTMAALVAKVAMSSIARRFRRRRGRYPDPPADRPCPADCAAPAPPAPRKSQTDSSLVPSRCYRRPPDAAPDPRETRRAVLIPRGLVTRRRFLQAPGVDVGLKRGRVVYYRQMAIVSPETRPKSDRQERDPCASY